MNTGTGNGMQEMQGIQSLFVNNYRRKHYLLLLKLYLPSD